MYDILADHADHDGSQVGEKLTVENVMQPPPTPVRDNDKQNGDGYGDFPDDPLYLRSQQARSSGENDWVKVRSKKRARIGTDGSGGSIGSVSDVQEFKSLSADDKLTTLFGRISCMSDKVDQCLAVHTRVRDVERRLDEHLDRITLLEYKSLDLESRSRRNNLLFLGIPESPQEDCSGALTDFLKSRLDINPCPPVPRAHRLGRFQRGKVRPIIACFLDYRDTELILSKARLLRDTAFSINRDFPREIAEARRRLWPELKSLRSQFPQSRVSIAYPAKIIKDGRVHRDEFPDWNLVLNGARQPSFPAPPATRPPGAQRARGDAGLSSAADLVPAVDSGVHSPPRQPSLPAPTATRPPGAQKARGDAGSQSAGRHIPAMDSSVHSQPSSRCPDSRPASPPPPRASRRRSPSVRRRHSRGSAPSRQGRQPASTTAPDPSFRRPWDSAPVLQRSASSH